jgi:hypothetical protein
MHHAGREVEAEVAHALLRSNPPKGHPRAAGRIDDGGAVSDLSDRRHARVERACVAAPYESGDQAREPLAPDVSAVDGAEGTVEDAVISFASRIRNRIGAHSGKYGPTGRPAAT